MGNNKQLRVLFDTTSERRAQKRQPFSADVMLYCDGQRPFRGRCVNIAPGGLYVQTHPERFQPDARVFVALTLRQDGETREIRLATRVARLCIQGAGLRLSDFSLDFPRSLTAMLPHAYDNGTPADRIDGTHG
jgi:hypothetical protein